MNTRIHEIAKEIKYLKSNLSTVDGNFRMRMQEEIQNLEFDMEYLKRNTFSTRDVNQMVRSAILAH
jgi:hypothetical protein